MDRIKKEVNRQLRIFTGNGVYNSEQTNRSSLHVSWQSKCQKKKAIAIGINPSTANDEHSDKTVTTLARFLDAYGFTEFTMLNLFQSYSTPQSGIVHSTKTDFSDYKEFFKNADAIIIVWGLGKNYSEEKKETLQILKEYKEKLFCIEKNGRLPIHPSRMSYKCSIKPFIINTIEL